MMLLTLCARTLQRLLDTCADYVRANSIPFSMNQSDFMTTKDLCAPIRGRQPVHILTHFNDQNDMGVMKRVIAMHGVDNIIIRKFSMCDTDTKILIFRI